MEICVRLFSRKVSFRLHNITYSNWFRHHLRLQCVCLSMERAFLAGCQQRAGLWSSPGTMRLHPQHLLLADMSTPGACWNVHVVPSAGPSACAQCDQHARNVIASRRESWALPPWLGRLDLGVPSKQPTPRKKSATVPENTARRGKKDRGNKASRGKPLQKGVCDPRHKWYAVSCYAASRKFLYRVPQLTPSETGWEGLQNGFRAPTPKRFCSSVRSPAPPHPHPHFSSAHRWVRAVLMSTQVARNPFSSKIANITELQIWLIGYF